MKALPTLAATAATLITLAVGTPLAVASEIDTDGAAGAAGTPARTGGSVAEFARETRVFGSGPVSRIASIRSHVRKSARKTQVPAGGYDASSTAAQLH